MSIVKKASGRWTATHRDADGKIRSLGTFATRREAQRVSDDRMAYEKAQATAPK